MEIIEKEIGNKQGAEDIKEMNENFRTIFHNTGTAMLIIDKDAKILEANATFERESGYSIDEIKQESFIKFIAPESQKIIMENFYKRKLDPENTPSNYSVKCFNKYLQLIDTNITVAALPDGNIIVSCIDITEQKKAEAAVKQHLKSQELLLEISQDFTKVLVDDIDDLINKTLKKIGEFDNNDRCCVFLFADGCDNIMQNTHMWVSGETISNNKLPDVIEKNSPWWMSLVRKKEVIHIPKVSDLAGGNVTEKEGLQAQGIKSILVVPIIYENRVLGCLGFDSVCKEKQWQETSISLLKIVSNIFANALERKKYISAIEESEKYYHTIFENTGAATYIADKDMVILKANGEWERSFGYKAKELEGTKWTELFFENDLKMMEQYHYSRRIQPSKAPRKYTTCIKDKNGKIRDCLVTVDLIPGTKISVATHADISEFQKINRRLKAIISVNNAMLYADNEESLLEAVCRDIVNVGGYSFAWIGYLDKDANKSVRPIAYYGNEEGYLKTLNIKLSGEMKNVALVSKAILKGQTLICEDLEKDKNILPWREGAIKRGYKSILAIPLAFNGKDANGALVIYSDGIDVFNEEEVKILNEMADNLVYGIKYLRTKQERYEYQKNLKISYNEIKQLFEQTIESLTTIMEVRDPYTANHQRRVASLATAIAKEMGLPENLMTAILIASSLHDIGKLSVPSDILNKPGKITGPEFSIIKAHCEIGFEVIKKIKFPWAIDEIILQHHERMDGSGYPQGLKGERINLAARIIAVADVVEAMSSHRPYRAALGIEKALEEITNEKGVKYDTDVVDACLNIFQKKGFGFPNV